MTELNLIYYFKSSQNQSGEFKPARYKVIFFFSAEGFLEQNKLTELAKSVPEADYSEMTFLNLDDLKAFAHRVAQEYNVSSVRLTSVQDYNIGLDGAKDLGTFRDIFNKFGEVVVNEELSKKKGFFGKFFG